MSDSITRKKWINNDVGFLGRVAQQICDDRSIRSLTAEDTSALKSVTRKDIWAQRPATPINGSIDNTADKDGEVDVVTALFRSRYLVYENSIYAELFAEAADYSSPLISPFSLQKQAKAMDAQEAESRRAKLHPVRSEEDDYDDEDEDDEEERDSTVTGVQSTAVRSQTSGPESEIRVSSAGNITVESAAEDRRNENTILKFEIDSYYHTLEYDRHALLEQNTLEASDRQVEEESHENGKEKLSTVSFGAANLSLRHLIAKIDQSREKLAMSDNELRNLLSDVRKNRSKWANEEKVGQEELYEAAERVVLELRGYTEHSTAFLNKVTKREVPDYYNIIKEPMDLGTLMKNLKNILYKSKAEFARDVMLIWQNCLTYNADAAHPLRKHAEAMRRKSEQLLAMVPDVVIRDRADVEAEEFGLMEEEQDEEEEEEDTPLLAGKSTRGTFGPKSTKAKKAKPTEVKIEQDDSNGLANGNDEHAERERSKSPERLTLGQKSLPSTKENGHVGQEHGQESSVEVEQVEETDAAFQVWRTRTKKSRARYAAARQKRIRPDTLRPDEPALRVTPFSLVALPHNTSGMPKRVLESMQDLDNSAFGQDNLIASDELLLREYEVCSVPKVLTTSDDMPAMDNAFSVLNVVPYEATTGGLIEKMRATTIEMKNIRRLCTKLSTLKLMQEPSMASFPPKYFRDMMDADTPLKFQPMELVQSGYDVEPCGQDLARALMQRTSAHILYHSGFEDFQPQALEAFTEMASHSLMTIGKILKDYQEAPQHLSFEECIRHTLFEVGIDKLNTLGDYISEEVDSRSDKVTGLHDRLRKFLNDFIQGRVDGESGEKSLFDDNNRDAFVSGSFGEETGEDFFGFRELGLDKEFGLSSLSVPLRLLQGRLRPIGSTDTTVDGDAIATLRFDRRFPHITREVASRQIAIFQPFLESKFQLLEDDDAPYLVEDEDLPLRQRKPKPRLGTSGKILSAMKRPLKDPTNVSPKKKKKLEREGTAMSPTFSRLNSVTA